MLKYSSFKYDQFATDYEKKWPGYLESTHKKALELLDPQEGETILDAAAGTGALTKRILSRLGENGKVHMAEISPRMRAVARERLHRHPNVHIDSADVHDLDYTEETFDRIVCANAFHFFEQPEKVVSEFARVLRSSGRLVIVDLSNDSAYFRLYDKALQWLSKPHQKTYTTDEMKAFLEEVGFEIEKVDRWNYKLWSLMSIAGEKT